MKKVFTVLALVTLFCVSGIEKAEAIRIPIPAGRYAKLSKVKDLPQEEEYLTKENKHFDLGVSYQVYQIFWIPVWTEVAPQLIGYIDNEYYVNFDDETIEAIAELNEIENIQQYAKMPFWDAWGGKIIVLGIVGLILYGYFGKSGKDDEDEIEAAA